MFGSALLRCEGVRGFGFGIGCSGVIQITRDGCRQVGIGHIGIGTVTVVTAGDNPDNDENPFQDDPPKEEPREPILALAHAINTLTQDVHRVRQDDEMSGWTKLHEPDQFDGTDPKKLHTFLIQCELNFQDQPRAFHTDCTKVTFAQSYLKGMALEWFEPDLLNCNGRIFYLFILSYRTRLSYLIMVLVLSSLLSMAVA